MVESIETARALLIAASQQPDWVGYAELERRLGGSPTRQALMAFAEGKGGRSFWKRLLRTLRGDIEAPDLAEEATRALRLLREAEAALARVVQQLPATATQAAQLAALDAPMLSAPKARPLKTGTKGRSE